MRFDVSPLKEIMKNPVLLSKFRVFISGDDGGKMATLCTKVDLPLDHFQMRGTRTGDVVTPYFDGRMDQPITFKMHFRESEDHLVERFFGGKISEMWGRGLINVEGEKRARLNVTVFQLNTVQYQFVSDDVRVKLFRSSTREELIKKIDLQEPLWYMGYQYSQCSYKEITEINYADQSNESLIRSYEFYPRVVNKGYNTPVDEPKTDSFSLGSYF